MTVIASDDLEALPANIRERIEIIDGHWIWQGTFVAGYGRTTIVDAEGYNATAYAHRGVYGALRELNPTDKLKRNCEKRACVHPDHWKRIVKVPRG